MISTGVCTIDYVWNSTVGIYCHNSVGFATRFSAPFVKDIKYPTTFKET